MADEYDELHKKLGADKLDKDQQKELLQKFKEVGGEVVKPSRKSKAADGSKKKRRTVDAVDSAKAKRTRASGAKEEADAKSVKGKEQKEKEEASSGFFDRLSLYLSALFSGVITLSGGRFKEKFIYDGKTTLHNELVTLDKIIDFVINPKKGDTKLFKGMMLQRNSYFYELLRLSRQLYRKEDFELLSSKTGNLKDAVDTFIVEEPLRKIYRRLYLFHDQLQYLRSAIELGLNVQMEVLKLDSHTYQDYLKRSRTAVTFIYGEYFQKLHYAFCKIAKENILLPDQRKIYDILQIQDTEKIEYLIQETLKSREKVAEEAAVDKGKKQQVPEEQVKEEEVGKEEAKKETPDYLKAGEDWVRALNYTKDKTTEKDAKYYFDDKDKILSVYVILEEFEKEFSFILTSNKIRFNIDMFDGKKTDTKKELNSLYLGINSCHDTIKDYVEILKQLYKIQEDAGLGLGKRDGISSKLSVNQTRISNIIRTRLLDVIRPLERLLFWAAEKSDSVIQNSGDRLHFDTIDGKKRLEGKTATQAVSACASYIGYVRFLLEDGKLYGSSPMLP